MRSNRRFDVVRLAAICGSAVALLAVVALGAWLAIGSVAAFRHEGLSFLTANDWGYRQESFGAAAMLYGTAVVSLVALVVAAPIGVGTAIFASEICTRRVRLAIKMLVEILAGVPSVVYGLLGVLFLRDWLYVLFERLGIDALSGDTLLTAGLLLAVMILPTVATLADDALQSVPSRVREASRGLGLTRAEATLFVILPQALPSIAGALLLGLGRALGETIAVFLVVGRADNLLPENLASWPPLVDAGQTITSKLGGAETNIAVGDPLHSSAIVALAAILFGAVLIVTITAEALRARAAKVMGR
ncbi:MAG: phosphate ABC transporter permease subunit PstC [Thermoanaerobaculia bacterium]|nr:phosphate ABC transporter permease subunit PstC [Thermoanaerobaculia bacterium]